ncbi:unnamed protein product [Choristocarpus tenellus]
MASPELHSLAGESKLKKELVVLKEVGWGIFLFSRPLRPPTASDCHHIDLLVFLLAMVGVHKKVETCIWHVWNIPTSELLLFWVDCRKGIKAEDILLQHLLLLCLLQIDIVQIRLNTC